MRINFVANTATINKMFASELILCFLRIVRLSCVAQLVLLCGIALQPPPPPPSEEAGE